MSILPFSVDGNKTRLGMPVTLDLTNTYGAFLIGVVISAALFGVICLQTFYYFQNYGSDSVLVKIFVLTLLVLGCLHSILSTHAIYYYIIANYLNPIALLDSIWSLTVLLELSGTIIVAVHMFYIRRVFYISHKNMPLVALIFVLSLAHWGLSIVVTVNGFRLVHFSVLPEIVPYMTASLAFSIATDIIIAGSLSFLLHRSRSGVQKTDTMINRLMMYAINNGILTSVFGIVIIILITTQPQNFIFISVYLNYSHLHTNSMLATLNSRRSVARASENTGISFRLPTSTFSMPVMNGPDNIKPGDMHLSQMSSSANQRDT